MAFTYGWRSQFNINSNLITMKIIEIISQSRRDMRVNMQCESCNHIEEGVYVYDDANFHENVIPDMKCKKCGEKSPKNYQPLNTRYPEFLQV